MLLALIFFSYALVCLLFYDLPAYRMGKESVSWKHVEGSITRSELRKEVRLVSYGKKSHRLTIYIPDIEYEYVVDEKRYTSTQLYSLSDSIQSEQYSDSKAMLRRYKLGSPVDVYYNDQDPSVAVLEPGLNEEHETNLEFHCFVVLITGCLFLWGLWS